jgi:hypothetical protein
MQTRYRKGEQLAIRTTISDIDSVFQIPKEKCLLNLVQDGLVQVVIADRVADAEQWRTGHHVLRARRLGRRAARASERAQRLSRQATVAQRQARLIS